MNKIKMYIINVHQRILAYITREVFMDLLNTLLTEGKSQFHVIDIAKNHLLKNGYSLLSPQDDWNLSVGGKYIVMPYPSVLFAFNMGNLHGDIRIAASHSDFPMLKLKPKPEIVKKSYLEANVEPYGGLIMSTWFDRPLGLAGKVILRSDNIFSPVTRLFDSKKPVFIIPSLAPHLKKETDSRDLDKQKELIPVCGCNNLCNCDCSSFILDYISRELDIDKEDILDYDLYLYICESPVTIGINEELISSPRLDNISSVAAILEGLTGIDNSSNIVIGAFFDNEEIGSRSKQGADSMLFRDIINRMTGTRDLYGRSFSLSLDVAHATHPNYSEKSDITNDIIPGNGIVLKTSASQRYVTDSEAGGIITGLCRKYGIKLQKQVNNSNLPGGQTLGPIMSSYLPIPSVDMGIPILAMHSARELACKADYSQLVTLVKIFYEYQ